MGRSLQDPLNRTTSRKCPRLNLALQRPFHADPTYDCPRPAQPQRDLQEKSSDQLPEYLAAHEVDALTEAAPNPRARLLLLVELRTGLMISEALVLEPRDLSQDTDQPTIRVRQGKGSNTRIVPVHAEPHSALTSALQLGNIG